MTDPPLTLSVEDAARYAGVGRDRMYTAVQNGELPSVRVSYTGRTRRLLRSDVRAWVKGLREAAPHPPRADSDPMQETRR